MPSEHNDLTRLRPLSSHGWRTLAELAGGPMPAYQINPGVRERLRREGLVVDSIARSKNFVAITQAGRDKLKERP